MKLTKSAKSAKPAKMDLGSATQAAAPQDEIPAGMTEHRYTQTLVKLENTRRQDITLITGEVVAAGASIEVDKDTYNANMPWIRGEGFRVTERHVTRTHLKKAPRDDEEEDRHGW